MATDISKLGLKAKWQDLTEGMVIAGSGTSKDFNDRRMDTCETGIYRR